MVNRYYSSTATATTVTSGINGAVTSITVGSVTGFPITFPYTLILDEGETSEEVVQVNSSSGLNLTVTRGVDGTTGVSHASGATVVHGVSARDYREPQEHIAATTGVHGATGSIVGTGGETSFTGTVAYGANTASSYSQQHARYEVVGDICYWSTWLRSSATNGTVGDITLAVPAVSTASGQRWIGTGVYFVAGGTGISIAVETTGGVYRTDGVSPVRIQASQAVNDEFFASGHFWTA